MAGHVGKEIVASNGVTQGCPLSVLVLNLLMNTCARSVKSETTTAMPKVYADDGVLSKNSCDIDTALKKHRSLRHSHPTKTERGQDQGLENH